MKTINFIDDATGETVVFSILSAITYQEEGYLLVIEEAEAQAPDATAYVLKAMYLEEEDVIYELVSDDEVLDIVYPLLEEAVE